MGVVRYGASMCMVAGAEAIQACRHAKKQTKLAVHPLETARSLAPSVPLIMWFEGTR